MDGVTGATGAAGFGTSGATGADGVGLSGATGSSGSIGATGATGSQGQQGQDGASIISAACNAAPPTSEACNATVANWLWFCNDLSAVGLTNFVFLCDASSQTWVFVDDLGGGASGAGPSGATGATGAAGPSGAPGLTDGGHGVLMGNCSGHPPTSSRCVAGAVGVIFVCLDDLRDTYGCSSTGVARSGGRQQSGCTPAQPCWVYTGSLAVPVADPDYLIWCIVLGVVILLCLVTIILMLIYQLWLRHKHKEMEEQVNNLEVNKSVVVMNNTSSGGTAAGVTGAAGGRMRGRDRTRSLILENDKVVRRDSGNTPTETQVADNTRRLAEVEQASMDLDRMMLETEGKDYVDTSDKREEEMAWAQAGAQSAKGKDQTVKGKDQAVHSDPYAAPKGKEEEEPSPPPPLPETKPQFIFETRGIGEGRPGVEGAGPAGGRGRGSAMVKGRGRGIPQADPRFATMLKQELANIKPRNDPAIAAAAAADKDPKRLSGRTEADLKLAATLSNDEEDVSQPIPVAVRRGTATAASGSRMSPAALEQLERDKRALAGVTADAFEARAPEEEEVVIPVASRPKSFLAKKDAGGPTNDTVYNNPYGN
jgi:hypothetical protein